MFFAYTNEGLDPQTGLGLIGMPGSWPTWDESHLVDVSANGEFDLFGRTHGLIVGANYSSGDRTQYTRPADENDPVLC
ncbi:MAG TPA: hypothetical protein VNA21_04195 [Steroidobacteraceae bacterium]|nr:hypothetical protein [Steroidobacteraceae bacterium]